MSTDSYTLSGDKATINGVYTEDKRIEDSYRYIINIKNGAASIKTCFPVGKGKFNDQSTAKATHRVIALIIESPHKEEFDMQFNPIAPAQGATGENIRKYICHILNVHNCLDLKDNDYDLIICNPVQFQASLFHLHKTALNSKNRSVAALRDKVWLAIYQKEREHFLNRLTAYNPVAIINACTSKLKPLITSELIEWNIAKHIDIFVACKHPCIWSPSVIIKKQQQ
jgi:hypothetical protein